MSDEDELQGGNRLPKLAEELVSWATNFYGSLHSQVDLIGGAAISASSSSAGAAAGYLVRHIQAQVGWFKAPRVIRGLMLVKRKWEGKGVSPDQEEMADLLTESIPLFADAETNDKREVIATILANAGARGAAASEAEALEACSIIRSLPGQAVRVLALMMADVQIRNDQAVVDIVRSGYHGLPWIVVMRILREHLFGKDIVDDSLGRPEGGITIKFSQAGLWLRDWCTEHPPAEMTPNS